MYDPDELMSLDNRHAFSMPWWARPGLALFAKKADTGSGKGDEEDDDEDDEDDEDEDDEDDDDPLADLTEEELREELRETRAQLSKASGSSKKKRDQIKRLRDQIAGKRAEPKGKGKPKADDDEDDKLDAEAAREEGRSEARAAGDAKIKRTAIRGELKAAGVPSGRLARATSLIDLDELDVDDDGEVDGLEEALDELRTEWPELFPTKRKPRTRAAGAVAVTGRGDKGEGKKKLTTDQMQANVLRGRASENRRGRR